MRMTRRRRATRASMAGTATSSKICKEAKEWTMRMMSLREMPRERVTAVCIPLTLR